MKTRTHMMAITALTSALTIFSLPSYGHNPYGLNPGATKSGLRVLQLAQADTRIDSKQAAKIAKTRYGGKILGVSKKTANGGSHYQIKLLQKSGRVKIVSVGSDGKIR